MIQDNEVRVLVGPWTFRLAWKICPGHHLTGCRGGAGVESAFINQRRPMVFHDPHTVNPNTVNATAVCQPGKLMHDVLQRLPLGPIGIMADQVGFLSYLQGADFVAETESVGSVPGEGGEHFQ